MKQGKTTTNPGLGAAATPMAWSLAEVIQATGGSLLSGGSSAEFGKICTDSRSVEAGDLFVALRGENFDGHAYLAQAVEKGAAGVLVEARPGSALPAPVVLVPDTLQALGELAAYRRRQLRGLRVVAITGSCGKTTVKEMVAAILSAKHHILKTKGNFNNLVGLPLSLLPVTRAHEFAVLELGMNRLGEIARLTEIAAPDIACITNVQDAHLAGFADINGVATAKGELFAGAGTTATLVVNLDDRRVAKIARACPQEKITFGRSPRAMVRGLWPRSLGEGGMVFILRLGGQEARVKIRGLGVHNVQNALAAAAIAHAAGVRLAEIVSGLECFAPFEKRLQIQELAGGIRLINDAYNANPSSMLAALKTLRKMDRGHKKVVILGDMLELGRQSRTAHEELGRQVAALGFDALLAVGEFAGPLVSAARKAGMSKDQARNFQKKEEISAWLGRAIAAGFLCAGDWVLLKGSRGMRMETIVQGLLNNQGQG